MTRYAQFFSGYQSEIAEILRKPSAIIISVNSKVSWHQLAQGPSWSQKRAKNGLKRHLPRIFSVAISPKWLKSSGNLVLYWFQLIPRSHGTSWLGDPPGAKNVPKTAFKHTLHAFFQWLSVRNGSNSQETFCYNGFS